MQCAVVALCFACFDAGCEAVSQLVLALPRHRISAFVVECSRAELESSRDADSIRRLRGRESQEH